MKRLLIALFVVASVTQAVASDCWNNVAGTQTNCAQVPTFLNGSNQTVPVSSANPLPIAGAGGGGTSSTFSAAFPAAGTAVGAEFLTTPPTLTNGQMVPFFTDINGNLKVNVVVGGGTGGTSSTFGAAFPGTGTAIGAKNGANMVNLVADGSGNLDVNCIVGCAGGTTSNATSGVATSATNGASVAWLYLFNGTTWDQAQADASKNLKVNVAAGAVTANAGTNLNTSLLALDTSISGILNTQGSTTAGEKGPLIQGAVTSATPSYTVNQTSPLSLDTNGTLRVQVLGVPSLATGASTSGLQPTNVVQNTVTAGQTGTLGMAASTSAAPSFIDGRSNPLSTDLSGNLRVAAATLPLPAGAATAALQPTNATQGSTTSGQTGGLSQGAVTTTAPTYTTAQTNPLSLTTAGGLRVDGSGATQPISGTVTANQGTAGATWPVAASVADAADVALGATTDGVWSGTGSSTVTSTLRYIGNVVAGPIATGTNSIGQVTANAGTNLNTSALALSANQPTNAAQGSTTAGQTGNLLQAGVLTAPPSYTTAQTSPLTMDLAGNLRVVSSSWSNGPLNAMTVTTASHATGTVIGIASTNQPIQFLKTSAEGHIDSIEVTSKAVVASTITAYVFRLFPSSTTLTDAAAPAINAADVTKLLGAYPLSSPNSGLGTHTVWSKENIDVNIVANSFWILLVNTGAAFTPVSTTDFDIRVTGHY